MIEKTNDNLILKVSDLCVSYGAVQALHGVSLSVNEGETVCICGINGAGKSTIMKTIAGLLKPKSGNITYKGQEIGGAKPEKIHSMGLALVPEGRHIFPSLTVAENLRIGAFGNFQAKEYQKSLDEIYELFPILNERLHQGGGLLSGGEQQMLAIARGLVSNPGVLMLDEPSLGLSPNMVDQVFELIVKLKERGTTILLVEQNAERAINISDHAYILSNGKVEFSGKPSEIDAKEITEVYLGNKGGANS